MLDEVLLLIYGTAAAVILIVIVAHYYMPTLVGATQAQAEYVALRDAAPTLILAQNNKSVHICINSTAPQRVLIQRSDMWIDAQKDCRINPGGNCVPEGRAANRTWPLCGWYLGTYKPGDNLTVALKTDRATVVKSYRVAVVSFPTQLYVVPYVQNVTETVTVVATATMTGVVYHTTTVTVPETATVYRTYIEVVPATTTHTITYAVVIQDPSYTATHILLRCWNPYFGGSHQAAGRECATPMRRGFQPPTITITSTSTTTNSLTTTMTSYTTVTSYTTSYVTSYVTSTVSTTTIWTRTTYTYTPTVTSTSTILWPGVVVHCYICPTHTPRTPWRCDTTTLVTTTRTVTTITGYGAHGSVQPAAREVPSGDAFVLALSATTLMAGSVMLAKRR
jgi:hypothetical protein